MLGLDVSSLPPRLHVGTSSFSAADWRGVFYPETMAAGDFLRHYSTQLRTVEIDATWHVMPSLRMVKAWTEKTPEQFVFSVKVPKIITHESYLQDCEEEWKQFFAALEPFGEKRGPILFQFQYVAKGKDAHEYATGEDFRRRFAAFAPQLPAGGKYVVEVRNEKWLGAPLYDLLRQHGVSLALVDYYTMPSGPVLLSRPLDPITGDFAYVRFLGNHHAMDLAVAQAREKGERQGDWDALLVDRRAEMRGWIPAIRDLLNRHLDVFAYFNNHYAGFAPGSIEQFIELWREGASGPEGVQSRS